TFSFYFGASFGTSKCLVGASAPRCRVVPSVTLGGGATNSPVFPVGNVLTPGGGSTAGRPNAPADSARFSRSLMRIYCATPEPIIEKAGMSNQNHQPLPIIQNASAIDTNRKAIPINPFLKA